MIEMIEEKSLPKAQKKFEKAFGYIEYDDEWGKNKSKRVCVNLKRKFALNDSKTVAIITPDIKELMGDLKMANALKKLPIFRERKTPVIMNLELLENNITLLRAMGFTKALLKMSESGHLPLEIVAMDDIENIPKNPTRILIAPIITGENDVKRWIKYECRTIRQMKKKVKTVEEIEYGDNKTEPKTS